MNRIVRWFTEHITTSNPCFKQASQLCLAGSDRCPNRKTKVADIDFGPEAATLDPMGAVNVLPGLQFGIYGQSGGCQPNPKRLVVNKEEVHAEDTLQLAVLLDRRVHECHRQQVALQSRSSSGPTRHPHRRGHLCLRQTRRQQRGSEGVKPSYFIATFVPLSGTKYSK